MSARMTKRVTKNSVCSKCSKALEDDQLFCRECGEPSFVLKYELSMWNNFKKTWSEYSPWKGKNYPFVIFFFFTLFIPLGLIIYFTHDNYWINNLALLLFLPLIFIPFSLKFSDYKRGVKVKDYFSNLNYYPHYFVFVLLNVLYFFVLKYITMSVDPILNLVRLIMVLYWVTLMTPIPHYIAKRKEYPIIVLPKLIRASKEVRWQLFFTYFVLACLNIVGLAFAGIGLLFTIPFSIAVMENYYDRMDSHNLF